MLLPLLILATVPALPLSPFQSKITEPMPPATCAYMRTYVIGDQPDFAVRKVLTCVPLHQQGTKKASRRTRLYRPLRLVVPPRTEP
jgi:hypothetical protein